MVSRSPLPIPLLWQLWGVRVQGGSNIPVKSSSLSFSALTADGNDLPAQRMLTLEWESEGLQTVGIVVIICASLKLLHLLGLIDFSEGKVVALVCAVCKVECLVF